MSLNHVPKPWMVCSMRCVPKLQTQSPKPETDTQTLLIGQRTDMRARTHIRTAARWGGIVREVQGGEGLYLQRPLA